MQLLKKLLKRLAQLIGALFGLAVVLYLIAVIINWNDVPPSDLALEFEASLKNRPEVADDENLAVAINRLFRSPDDDFPRMPEQSEFAVALANDCQKISDDYCLDLVIEQQYGAEHWLDEHQWVLDRYIELLRFSDYQEEIPQPMEAIPSFGDVAYGHKLLMKSAMLSAINGDQPHVVALLEADLRFWRLVLANSDLLITKMIAAAYVRNHFLQGNKILRVLHESHRQNTLPLTWLVEISHEERSLRRPLVGEWRFMGNHYDSFDSQDPYMNYILESEIDRVSAKVSGALLVPLFQPQELKNMSAENIQWLIARQEAPWSELHEVAGADYVNPPHTRQPFGRIYNLAGDYLFPPLRFYKKWLTRTTDLEGVRRAAVVTTLMREQEIVAKDVPGFLEGSEFRDPYTDGSFDWDSDEREVMFDGLRDDRYDVYRLPF